MHGAVLTRSNRFKIMALTGMAVNHTGSNTYATYDDGTPVHTINIGILRTYCYLQWNYKGVGG